MNDVAGCDEIIERSIIDCTSQLRTHLLSPVPAAATYPGRRPNKNFASHHNNNGEFSYLENAVGEINKNDFRLPLMYRTSQKIFSRCWFGERMRSPDMAGQTMAVSAVVTLVLMLSCIQQSSCGDDGKLSEGIQLGTEKTLIFLPLTNGTDVESETDAGQGASGGSKDKIPDEAMIKRGAEILSEALEAMKRLSRKIKDNQSAAEVTDTVWASITDFLIPAGPVFKLGLKFAKFFEWKELSPQYAEQLGSVKEGMMQIKKNYTEMGDLYTDIDLKIEQLKERNSFAPGPAFNLSIHRRKVEAVYFDFLTFMEFFDETEVKRVRRQCIKHEIAGTNSWINTELENNQPGSMATELKETRDDKVRESLVMRLYSLALHAIVADYVCFFLPTTEKPASITGKFVDQSGLTALSNIATFLKLGL